MIPHVSVDGLGLAGGSSTLHDAGWGCSHLRAQLSWDVQGGDLTGPVMDAGVRLWLSRSCGTELPCGFPMWGGVLTASPLGITVDIILCICFDLLKLL